MIKRDLTPTDALAGYLVRWETAHLSCEPAQRPTAEHGIRAAYAAAGFPTPRIVWCRSPIEIAQEIAAAKLPHAIGRNVKTDVFDEVKRRVEVLVEVFCKETLTAAAELPNANSSNAAVADYNRFLSVCSGMSEIVDAAATECLSQFSVRTRHALMRLRGAPRLLPRYKFAEAAAGPLDLATLGVFEYLYEVAQWEELIAPLRGWWAIAKSGVVTFGGLLQKRSYSLMFDIRVFNALAAQTSMKIGQLSFNVTTPLALIKPRALIKPSNLIEPSGLIEAERLIEPCDAPLAPSWSGPKPRLL